MSHERKLMKRDAQGRVVVPVGKRHGKCRDAYGPPAEPVLEVLLPDGARVMLSNSAQVAPLARLLQALAEPC